MAPFRSDILKGALSDVRLAALIMLFILPGV